MTEKTLHVAVQYTRQTQAVAHVRPYANREPLRNEVGLWLTTESLPEPGHARVELHARATATNESGAVCFDASCIVEGIVAYQGLEGADLEQALRYIAAPSLMGTVRAVLTSVTSGTGYGPVVLPPLSVEAVAKLPAPPVQPAAEALQTS